MAKRKLTKCQVDKMSSWQNDMAPQCHLLNWLEMMLFLRHSLAFWAAQIINAFIENYEWTTISVVSVKSYKTFRCQLHNSIVSQCLRCLGVEHLKCQAHLLHRSFKYGHDPESDLSVTYYFNKFGHTECCS